MLRDLLNVIMIFPFVVFLLSAACAITFGICWLIYMFVSVVPYGILILIGLVWLLVSLWWVATMESR